MSYNVTVFASTDGGDTISFELYNQQHPVYYFMQDFTDPGEYRHKAILKNVGHKQSKQNLSDNIIRSLKEHNKYVYNIKVLITEIPKPTLFTSKLKQKGN